MIEVEIEDQAWVAALPDAEPIVIEAAKATLYALSSPPLRGRGQGEGGVGATLTVVPPTPPPSIPPRKGEGSNVSILLADDAAVKDLNARFRGKAAPTNVLSFPAPETARPHLGDIVLAYGVCAREAAEQGKSFSDHLTHLTAHGVLHLLGYDHETDADAEVMEGLEREILASLGVPDPYEADVPL